MIIEENRMLTMLKQAQRLILLEPNYKRKYPPLGLMKILSYLDHTAVAYQRMYYPVYEDLVCITTLFTYDAQYVWDAIEAIQKTNPLTKILIGGVYATLMADSLDAKYEGLYIFKGCSKILDGCVPMYDFGYKVKKPWDDYSYLFTSRGCPNRCGYCSVWRIEPDVYINSNWKDHIREDCENVMISDNNLSAQPLAHIIDIVKYLDMHNKIVTFDNGFDCKYMTPELAQHLARLKYHKYGLRLAFDRIEEDGIFQKAVKMLLDAGVAKDKFMIYCLYNFMDTPQEANYRYNECYKLGVMPYTQQYTPLNKTSKLDSMYIGKHWTENLLNYFRYYWTIRGSDISFEDFMSKDNATQSFPKITAEDWDKWNTNVKPTK